MTCGHWPAICGSIKRRRNKNVLVAEFGISNCSGRTPTTIVGFPSSELRVQKIAIAAEAGTPQSVGTSATRGAFGRSSSFVKFRPRKG